MKNILILVSFMCCSMPLYAEEVGDISTGRYSLLANVPPIEQRNPLRVLIKTIIPQSIKTVEGAIQFLLVRSGYSLLPKESMTRETRYLMNLNLPQVHRKMGPMTLDVALRTLCGTAYELVVDPVHRKITFELTTKLLGGRDE